jgi:hypothetical protein
MQISPQLTEACFYVDHLLDQDSPQPEIVLHFKHDQKSKILKLPSCEQLCEVSEAFSIQLNKGRSMNKVVDGS